MYGSRNAQEALEITSLSIKPDEARSTKLTRQWHMPSMPAKLVQSSAAPCIPEAGSISIVLGDDRQFHIFGKGFLAHPFIPALVESTSQLPQARQETISHDPLSQIISVINPENQPLYLQSDYSQADILIDQDGSVTGGTVPALVDRLIAHEPAGKPCEISVSQIKIKGKFRLDIRPDVFDDLYVIYEPR